MVGIGHRHDVSLEVNRGQPFTVNDAVCHAERPHGSQAPRKGLVRGRLVLRMDNRCAQMRIGDKLFMFVAQNAARVALQQKNTARPHLKRPQHNRKRVDDLSDLGFALPQRLLRRLALREVHNDRVMVQQSTVGITHGNNILMHMPDGAGLSMTNAHFHIEGPHRGQSHTKRLSKSGKVVRMDQRLFQVPVGQEVISLVTEHPAHIPLDEQDAVGTGLKREQSYRQ